MRVHLAHRADLGEQRRGGAVALPLQRAERRRELGRRVGIRVAHRVELLELTRRRVGERRHRLVAEAERLRQLVVQLVDALLGRRRAERARLIAVVDAHLSNLCQLRVRKREAPLVRLALDRLGGAELGVERREARRVVGRRLLQRGELGEDRGRSPPPRSPNAPSPRRPAAAAGGGAAAGEGGLLGEEAATRFSHSARRPWRWRISVACSPAARG